MEHCHKLERNQRMLNDKDRDSAMFLYGISLVCTRTKSNCICVLKFGYSQNLHSSLHANTIYNIRMFLTKKTRIL